MSVDVFRFSNLASVPGVAHAISTRRGGVSEGRCESLNVSYSVGDAEPNVDENLRRAAEAVGARREDLFSAYQVHGRVVTLERMRTLTLEIILRVVFGAGTDDEAARLREVIDSTLEGVRSIPRMLAMGLVRRDLGPWSPWGRFRIAVERFDALLFELLARRRAEPRGDSMLALLLEQRDADGNPPSDRHVRDQLVGLLVGGHDSSAASLAWAFERLARHPAVQARLREGDAAYLDAVVKEALRARPALTIAPRRLHAPVQIAGSMVPAIAVSGYGHDKDIRQSRAAGFEAHRLRGRVHHFEVAGA